MATGYEDSILRLDNALWEADQRPPAWAQHRSVMIHGTEWFSSLQGGFSYTSARPKVATGILINGPRQNHEYMDAEILISMINTTLTGGETERRRSSLEQAIAQNRLMGLIIGSKAAYKAEVRSGGQRARKTAANNDTFLLPCNNMPEQQECWIGDWFLPVKMWPVKAFDDKQNLRNGTRWMVKLQRWDLEKRSWWANPAHPDPPSLDERDFATATPTAVCGTCNRSSARIYHERFVCLYEDCDSTKDHANDTAGLTYSTTFLKERTDPRPLANQIAGPAPYPRFHRDFQQWLNQTCLPLLAQPVTPDKKKQLLDIFLTGFCCPGCRMMNVRDDWSSWRCRNTKCQATGRRTAAFRDSIPPPLLNDEEVNSLSPAAFRNLEGDTLAKLLTDLTKNPCYQSFSDTTHYTVYSYQFADHASALYFVPKPGVNARRHGADDLFRRFQELGRSGTFKLRRRFLTRSGGKGYSSHFNQNFGSPYSMVLKLDSIPFDQSPSEIREALDHVNNVVRPYRTSAVTDFNQTYVGAYIQGQKMSYHSDGETGLDDMIATYTLGGGASMFLRVNRKLDYGRATNDHGQEAKAKWIETDPVVPRCRKYTERAALKSRLDSGELSQEEWFAEFKDLMKNEKGARSTVVMEVPLVHGSIVVMHGKDCQTYFEHLVTVPTPIRFALTFRHVHPQNYATQLEKMAKGVEYDRQYTAAADDWIANRYWNSTSASPSASASSAASSSASNGQQGTGSPSRRSKRRRTS